MHSIVYYTVYWIWQHSVHYALDMSNERTAFKLWQSLPQIYDKFRLNHSKNFSKYRMVYCITMAVTHVFHYHKISNICNFAKTRYKCLVTVNLCKDARASGNLDLSLFHKIFKALCMWCQYLTVNYKSFPHKACFLT